MKNIRIIESFTSWQGEGPDTGRRMLILRYKHCNRSCKYCDTQVKMRISNEFEYSFTDIQSIVDDEKAGILLTGGEPTFDLNLQKSIDLINQIKCNVFNVETNGYDLEKLINGVNKNKNVKYMLSPKLFTQEDYDFYTGLITSIKDNDKVYIKLVYEGEAQDMLLNYLKSINFDNHRIYLMPEGKSAGELLVNAPIVFDACEKYKVNFSSREHIIYNFT